MLYKSLTIGGNEYKLRMTAAKIIEVEKRIGKNPVNVITEMDSKILRMPLMSDILAIFWGSLTKYQHGISYEAAADIFDEYIEDGHDISEFISDVLIPVFGMAGYFKSSDKTGEGDIKEKN